MSFTSRIKSVVVLLDFFCLEITWPARPFTSHRCSLGFSRAFRGWRGPPPELNLVGENGLLGCDIGGAKGLGVIYFPTNWGAKEPQNLSNHRIGWFFWTLPETNSSPLKMDNWNTILSYWGAAFFQGRTVSFRKGIFLGLTGYENHSYWNHLLVLRVESNYFQWGKPGSSEIILHWSRCTEEMCGTGTFWG